MPFYNFARGLAAAPSPPGRGGEGIIGRPWRIFHGCAIRDDDAAMLRIPSLAVMDAITAQIALRLFSVTDTLNLRLAVGLQERATGGGHAFRVELDLEECDAGQGPSSGTFGERAFCGVGYLVSNVTI